MNNAEASRRLKGTNYLSLWLPVITVMLIGVAYFFLARDIVFLGDDIGYYCNYVQWKGTWKGLPIAMHQHWEGNNGRMCDMLAPFAFNVIGINGRAVMNALLTILFFGMPLLLLKYRQNKLFWRMLWITLLAFTLRWDALWMENITLQDYVWPAGYAMLMMVLMLKGRPKSEAWWLWLLMPFCMAAGWMHEALGFPLAVGLIAYMIWGGFWKRAGSARRCMALAFVVGGLMSVFSAQDFNKLAVSLPLIDRDPVWQMLFCSGFYVLILVLTIIYTAIRDIVTLKKLIHSTWLMWTVASLVSLCFMLIIGYGGRPGWYAQIFALMALSMMVVESKIRINKRVELASVGVMLIMLVFHYGNLVEWQHRASHETAEIVLAARESETGAVFYDYMHDTDVPWFLLRKIHTFPDEDDTYYRMMMKDFYCRGNKITVLPKAAEKIDFDNFAGQRRMGKDIITSAQLVGEEDKGFLDYQLPVRLMRIGKELYVESAFRVKDKGKMFYYYTPYDYDPGYK